MATFTKTDEFTSILLRSVYNQTTNSDVYLFASDALNEGDAINSNDQKRSFLEKCIFGVKVNPDDVSYMFREVIWETGTIYDMYDDTLELETLNFYVIVEPEVEGAGDYHVFKCLFNNNFGASTFAPSYNSAIVQEHREVHSADGYVWKYMFSVPYLTVQKFRTRSYFPLVEDANTVAAADDGISAIQVENYVDNIGYEKIEGTIKFAPDNTGRVVLTIPSTEYFETTTNFYNGRVLYTSKDAGSGLIGAETYVISGSGQNSSNEYYVDITGYNANAYAVEVGNDAQILPRVLIEGDGAGAEGIAVFDDANEQIVFIQMLERGTGYRSATARIVDPIGFNTAGGDVRAELRPIISPKNGHGSDAVEELRCDGIGISTTITSFATDIPSAGEYSKIGLVWEPTVNSTPDTFDNRLAVTVASVSSMAAGDTVSQTGNVVGTVAEVNAANSIVYLVNYNGAYSGTWDANNALIFNQTNINITNIDYSPYTQRTGDPIYIADFELIERDEDRSETVKILIDF